MKPCRANVRRAAAKQARSGPSRTNGRLDRELVSVQQLREELETERLALEGQQAALARTQRDLEASRDRYIQLYDFAPVGIATLGPSNLILNINATGADLLESPRNFLVGRPLLGLFSGQNRADFRRHLNAVRRRGEDRIDSLRFSRGGLGRVLEFNTVAVPGPDRASICRMVFRDVTEVRRAERVLYQEHAELALVTDAAPVLISRCSRDLSYVFVNLACAEFLGRPREEIIGKRIVEILGPRAMKVVLPYIKQALAGHAVDCELEVPYSQVGPRFMRISYRPERASSGDVVGWIAALTDITQRRQMEAALRESEARFRQMADCAPVLIWLRGSDNKCTYFNKPWLDFTGRSLRQELGEGWAEGVHPDDVQDCLRSYHRAFQRRKALRIEYRLRRQDGKYRWVADHSVPRFLRGQFLGYIGSCVDITERRRAEELLRADNQKLENRVRARTMAKARVIQELRAEVRGHRLAERALRRSEKNLSDFFEQSPLALFWVSVEGRIQRVNERALQLLERSVEQCEGEPIARFIIEPGVVLEILGRLTRKLPLETFRARLRTGRGQIRHVLIDAGGMWEQGRLRHSRWFVRDITDRIQLEQELLAISEREQRRLGQDLHDDLCQRLSAIEFLSQTLSARMADGPPENKRRVHQIARLLRESIQHARELARGLAPVQLEEEGLAAALRDLVLRTQKIFRVRCRLKTDGLAPTPDPNIGIHLYRIAQEAVNNAIRHGRARRIDIEAHRLREHIYLAVHDNGVGIPRRRRPGRGMGLRVMQYRAALIGGSLSVQRQNSGGTSVVCVAKEETPGAQVTL